MGWVSLGGLGLVRYVAISHVLLQARVPFPQSLFVVSPLMSAFRLERLLNDWLYYFLSDSKEVALLFVKTEQLRSYPIQIQL